MSQWKVIDANFLRVPALATYLKTDVTNGVVFTEYSCMESYKGDAFENITRSLEIVSRFSKQVVILKCTTEVVALQSEREAKPQAFIDKRQTEGFPRFCSQVCLARNGDPGLRSQIDLLGPFASDQFQRIRNDALKFRKGVLAIKESLGSAFCMKLRKSEPVSRGKLEGQKKKGNRNLMSS